LPGTALYTGDKIIFEGVGDNKSSALAGEELIIIDAVAIHTHFLT
jgi:hypothetical protein